MANVQISPQSRPATEESTNSVAKEEFSNFFTRLGLNSPVAEEDTLQSLKKQSKSGEKKELQTNEESPSSIAEEFQKVEIPKPEGDLASSSPLKQIEHIPTTPKVYATKRKAASARERSVKIADIPPSREVAVHYVKTDPISVAKVEEPSIVKNIPKEEQVDKQTKFTRLKSARIRKPVENISEISKSLEVIEESKLESIVISHFKKIEQDILDIKKYQTLGMKKLETINGPVRQDSFSSKASDLASIPEDFVVHERPKTAPSNVSGSLKSILKKKDTPAREIVSRPCSAASVSSTSNISGYGQAFSQSRTFHIDPSLFKKFDKLKKNIDKDQIRPKSGQTIRFAPETKNSDDSSKNSTLTSKSTQIAEPAIYDANNFWPQQWIAPSMAPIPMQYYQPIEYSYPYYVSYPEYEYFNYPKHDSYYADQNANAELDTKKENTKPKLTKKPSEFVLMAGNTKQTVAKPTASKKTRNILPAKASIAQPRSNPYTNNSKIKRHAKDFLSSNPKGKLRQLYSETNNFGGMEKLQDDRWT
ncbi:hypothetical protein HDV01_003024 [Terramyces sp. JEL0728]|nr:hypothetical protein HDV01_003024 [Terramyces sp. JEL0728]